MEDMTYEQVVQLERNIKIKNKAREIVSGFKKNVSLDLTTKKGLKFIVWSDMHNETSVTLDAERIIFICDFIHEKYCITVDESNVFSGISSNDRVIGHLASAAKVDYNEHDYK